MAREILYPSALDYLRAIHANAVDNLLAGKPSFADLPSSYQRAYILGHGTGLVVADTDFQVDTDAPEAVPVSIIKDPRAP